MYMVIGMKISGYEQLLDAIRTVWCHKQDGFPTLNRGRSQELRAALQLLTECRIDERNTLPGWYDALAADYRRIGGKKFTERLPALDA